MIEWIKFKGSSDFEMWNEVSFPFLAFNISSKCYMLFNADEKMQFNLKMYTHWAPLNLPQEEKWEREFTFNTLMHSPSATVIGDYLNDEFDNIYSILNELRKR